MLGFACLETGTVTRLMQQLRRHMLDLQDAVGILPPMDWRAHITSDLNVCHGKACIKGTRIITSVVLDNLAAGQSPDDILKLYPTLKREDVAAVLAYAAELARERVVPIGAA